MSTTRMLPRAGGSAAGQCPPPPAPAEMSRFYSAIVGGYVDALGDSSTGDASAYPPTAAREQTFRDRRFGPMSGSTPFVQ